LSHGVRPRADLGFAVLKVKKGWLYDTVRACVEPPVLGKKGVPPEEAARSVRDLWRRRVNVLGRDHGWGYASDWRKVQALRNCRPFGLETADDPGSRFCERPHVCPFCYGRSVVANVLLRFARVVEGGVPEGAALIEWSVHRSTTRGDAWLDRTLAWLGPDRRRRQVDVLKPLGAACLTRVYLTRKTVAVRRTGLALCVGDVPPLEKIDVRTHPPTKAGLGRAARRAFRYPGWLLRGSPADAAAFLEGFKGRRLLATYGALRGVGSRGPGGA
jgi:hypothetical protein